MNYKFYIETYGCASNQADSEIISGLLQKEGWKETDDPKKADVLIINTCNVKEPTSNKMLDRIRKLSQLKKPLIIAGCMPKTERKKIESINPKVSLIGPDSIHKIRDVAIRSIRGEKVVFLEDLRVPKLCLPRIRKNPIIAIVPIGIGCASQCSYCITKFARGELFSYPLEMIVEEIKTGLKEGCKEFWLTSQDCGCYGIDRGYDLCDLLEEVCKLEGRFFVRIGMMNPQFVKRMVKRLPERYSDEKIFKFLHLPVQSGSNKILRKMRRGYKVEDFLKIVKEFRKKIKDVTLATDIIVGFPGETEKDFEKSLKLIRKVRPDIVNISRFGARPGTDAAKLEPLPISIVRKRSRMMHELVERIKLEKNEEWVGKECYGIVDEIGRNKTYVARNTSYKPIVIRNNLLGRFVKIKVEKAKANYLEGRVVSLE